MQLITRLQKDLSKVKAKCNYTFKAKGSIKEREAVHESIGRHIELLIFIRCTCIH